MTRNAASDRSTYADPWRPARWGLVAIAAFAGLLALWGGVAPLSGAVIADGSFEVEGRRQSVQHPYGGVVTDLLVEEGEDVAQGDVLVRLSSTEARAQFDVLDGSRNALLARKARLVAERDGLDEPDFAAHLGEKADDPALEQIVRNELAVLETRGRQYTANIDLVEQRIVQFNEQSDGINAQIDGLTRQAALLEDETGGARRLLEQGYTPRTRVLELERAINDAETEIGVRRSERLGVEESIGEARLEMARLERERLSDVTERLQEVDEALAELGPKIEAAGDMLERTEIRAPATGRVVGLSVFTEGGVIDAGGRLMDIVPASNPLFVEARLRLSDISDVAAGQMADVRLLGTPRSVRPKIDGRIVTISADSLADERTGERYYSLQVALDAEQVGDAGMVLQPGMPVQVVIETAPRTLVGYLTSPIMDEVTGAFRER